MKTLVIESVDTDGTEWGLSLDGPNPTPENYVACRSEADAWKLHDRFERQRIALVAARPAVKLAVDDAKTTVWAGAVLKMIEEALS